MSIQHACDVLIVGSGAAGLSVALSLAEHCQVIVLSKSNIKEGSTRYAQGGIAAVFDQENDSIDSHVQDTLIAGAGLCNEEAVRFTATNASTRSFRATKASHAAKVIPASLFATAAAK